MIRKNRIRQVILPQVTKYQTNLSNFFAKYCYETNIDEYERRNQLDSVKIINDIYFGKISEYAVFNYFFNRRIKVTPPDILIYEKKRKSFDPDLTVNKTINIHVKSCKDSGIFPNSWLFQPYDSITTKPTYNDFFALTIHKKEEIICYFISAYDCLNLYKNPIKQNLNKKCIYETDLYYE